MTELKKMREWLETYDGMPNGADFQVDYNRVDPTNAGLHSNGLTEISRTFDVVGNCIVYNQLNFALHIVFPKPPDDDFQSTENAEWVLNFQKWVQEQSVRGKAPKFGNYNTDLEVVRAQNGAAYTTTDEHTGMYAVTISAQYREEIRMENE